MKTLEDFRKYETTYFEYVNEEGEKTTLIPELSNIPKQIKAVSVKDLRKSAIEDIKELRKELCKIPTMTIKGKKYPIVKLNGIDFSNEKILGIIFYIKWKFNITESDLK